MSTQHTPGLLEAARAVVAMTYHEARDADRRMSPKLYCQCDVRNPCWDNRPDDVPGKHWGGGNACRECNLRAAIAKATVSTLTAQQLIDSHRTGDSILRSDAKAVGGAS